MSPGTSLYWILTSAFLSFNALPHFKMNGTPSHLNSRKGWSKLFHLDWLQHMHLNNKNFKQTTTLGHQQGCALVQPFVVDPEDCGGKSWAGGALWHCRVLRSGKSDKQMWNLTTNKYVWCCFWFLWVWAPGDIQDVHPHQDGQGRPHTKKSNAGCFQFQATFTNNRSLHYSS